MALPRLLATIVLAAALGACLADPMPTPGTSDATCKEDETVGPLGTCVVKSGFAVDAGSACAHTCGGDADCPIGTACFKDAAGCTSCRVSENVPCRKLGDECHGGECCEGGCVAPTTELCGNCQRTLPPCSESAGCAEGEVCSPAPKPACWCGEGVWKACRKDCRDAGCDAGDGCQADGTCSQINCKDGFTCPAWLDCAGTSGDAHGCQPHLCSRDADCATKACVNGACEPSPGVCRLPPG